MMRRVLALVAIALAGCAAAHAGPRAAIFPFELIDDSLEGQYLGGAPGEPQRLVLATAELRKLAARDAGYEVVDLGPIASDIEKASPLYKCSGCEVDLARRAGADLAVTLAVRKFSSMLLSLHIYVKEVDTGNLIQMYRVDLRGNTDDTWLHGVRRLVAESIAKR